jgi:hypothetical protein
VRPGRVAGHLVAAVGGAVLGALIVLGASGLGSSDVHRSRASEAAEQTLGAGPRPHRNISRGAIRHVAPRATVLLAWTPGGLPRRVPTVLRHTPGVRDVTSVLAGLEWIESSSESGGTVIDAPPKGFAIPLEVAFVKPEQYASFVPPGDRQAILSLSPSNAAMARTEAQLRRAGEGLVLHLNDRTLDVTGVVSDVATQGYEILTSGRIPDWWQQTNRFVLMHVEQGHRRAIEKRLRRVLGPGRPLRIRAKGETPFLRYGDAVLPQMLIKKSFGEFAARVVPGRGLEIDPAWTKQNLLTAPVPLLGRVTCNRVLFPQLRHALSDLASSGLGYVVDPSDYGGCYAPGFLNTSPSSGLSHHSWGIAIDLNVSHNLFGSKPNQDPRLVRTMESWGFTWGGRWLIPDGMHFEWVSFP